ncbi:hypothetical protein VTO73DRAFT_13809 [Trametes versicolor]
MRGQRRFCIVLRICPRRPRMLSQTRPRDVQARELGRARREPQSRVIVFGLHLFTDAPPSQGVACFCLRATRSRSAVLECTVRDRHHPQTPSR